ncbi:MAG: DEAD/DEAH box helicase [Nitrososphaerales archaeon]
MQRYRCPRCKAKLDLKRAYDGRALFHCVKCGLKYLLRTRGKSEDEEYMQMLLAYDKGEINLKKTLEEILESEGFIRRRAEVEQIINEAKNRGQPIPPILEESLRSNQDYLVYYKLIEEEKPTTAIDTSTHNLPKPLTETLSKIGINTLYSFQAEAIKHILKGEDVVIAAPTGSGKTEAFTIPILTMLSTEANELSGLRIEQPKIKALFIYPTKALARDQQLKIKRLAEAVGIEIGVFDGDTPKKERERILQEPPHIILTNFDTIHHHLIHRTAFSRLLKTTKIIVVDEVHVYTGTFGSNIHFIIKRLERIANRLQIIAASATIANPAEFCETLFRRRFKVIKEDKGKHGALHFTILFPTLRSHRALVVDTIKKLFKARYKPLIFSSSHLSAELNAYYAKREGVNIAVHRAGLPDEWRKKVEEDFRRGILKAISTTPTLELGIDIGSVDAVVSDLVPINRLIQRAGRAGRRGQEALIYLLLRDNDPISQYYRNHPEQYFKDIPHAYTDPFNPTVAEKQILAAALDKPIHIKEFQEYKQIIENLTARRLLYRVKDVFKADTPTARRILSAYNIRGSGENVAIIFNSKKIGERALPQALEELHPEAVYLHAGIRYKSKTLKVNGAKSYAEVETLPQNYPYYTKPLKEEWPHIKHVIESKQIYGLEIKRVELEIEKKVIGYVNIEINNPTAKGRPTLLHQPVTYRFNTKGIVFKAPTPHQILQQYRDQKEYALMSSYHATEHLMIEATNPITGGVAEEMGGISIGTTGLIFIYDGAVGGNGATKALYDRFEEAHKKALEIVEGCGCTSESGCPRCTYSYKCGNNNEFLLKKGAIEVLRKMITTKIYVDLEAILYEKPIV